MSLFVITDQDSYKYTFKSFPFQHVAIVLPRDAMQKRGLCCRPVSVCASRCSQTAEDIVKLLSRHGSPIIL